MGLFYAWTSFYFGDRSMQHRLRKYNIYCFLMHVSYMKPLNYLHYTNKKKSLTCIMQPSTIFYFLQKISNTSQLLKKNTKKRSRNPSTPIITNINLIVIEITKSSDNLYQLEVDTIPTLVIQLDWNNIQAETRPLLFYYCHPSISCRMCTQ